MKGLVAMINSSSGMVAVFLDQDDFTVFELLNKDCDIDIGDRVSGDLDSLGSTILVNESNNNLRFEVFVEDVHSSTRIAKKMLEVAIWC